MTNPHSPEPPGQSRRARRQRTLAGDVLAFRNRLGNARQSQLVALCAGCLAAGLIAGFGLRSAGPQLSTSGPADGAIIGPASIGDLVIRAHSSNARSLDSATLTLDGGDVTEQARTGNGDLVLNASALHEGSHEVDLTVGQSPIPWPIRRSWRFTIDNTQPAVKVTAGEDGNARGRPVVISGTVNEPVRLAVDAQPVAVSDGHFRFALAEPPIAPPTIRAIDRAGNATTLPVKINVVPRAPKRPTRAIHVSAIAWNSPIIRKEVFAQIDRGALTAVELDLKDERGTVGYDSKLPEPLRIGAVAPQYVLKDAIREIHSHGASVVGRLVVFKDPAYAKAAWAAGHRDRVIQGPDGLPFSANAGFTNVANAAVRSYNEDIAVEAAKAGIDEVLFDYVRRPDGPIETMRFPGIGASSPTDEVIRFLAETQARFKPYGTLVGASVFGIAASRPDQIAQDVNRMSRYLDVVSPMLYPSVWGRGEYQVADPERQPEDIIRRSLRDFLVQMKGNGARPVPWLQAYSGGVTYGPEQIRAQIDAARKLGVNEFLLWNADVQYPFSALDPAAGSAAVPDTSLSDQSTTDGSAAPPPATQAVDQGALVPSRP